jgi:D-alanine-D-alanine ligase
MIGQKMKVAVLYDLWEQDGAAAEPEPEQPARKKQKSKKRKPKHDREEVFEALEKLGHEPFYHVLDGRSQTLASLARCGADLVFNLTESYAGDDTKDMNIAAYLELLGLPYTGNGPHALMLAQDKAIAKKMFAFHGVRTPHFATAYKGKIEHAHDISFPLIIKPAREDGSIGIGADSVVNTVKELMEQVEFIQEEFDAPVLIEEYIEGREIYAGVIGSYERAYALPLIELDLSKLPSGTPRIAGTDVKFERDTEAYKLTKSAPVEGLEEEIEQRLIDTALAAYRAVKLRDYGRIDMRLTDSGEVYVLEANPNPWLASGQEFAMAAKKSGLSYTQLIGQIIEMAIIRSTEAKARAELVS